MTSFSHTWPRWSLLAVFTFAMTACSSAPEKPQAAPLPAVSGQVAVQKVWANAIGSVTTPLLVSVHGDTVAVASSQGQVALIQASTGQDVWRVELDSSIQAGVGGGRSAFCRDHTKQRSGGH